MSDTLSIDEALAHLALVLKRKNVAAWEIYASQVRAMEIESRDQEVEHFEVSKSSGIGIRVLCGERMGFSHTNDFSRGSLDSTADKAVAASSEISPDPYLCFPEPGGPLPEMNLVDQKGLAVSEEDKIEKALLLERTALKHDMRVKRVRSAKWAEDDQEVLVVNSQGLNRRGRGTLFTASLMAVAEQDGDSQMAYEFDFSHFYDRLLPEIVARSAAERAVKLLGGRPLPGCQCPVVFSQEAAAELLGVTAAALSAESVDKGKSWLIDKMDRTIFSRKLRIIDHGSLESAPESFPFDGEGVATEKTVLVDSGKLLCFLSDTYYAKKRGARSSGNGVRGGYLGTPHPGPLALYIEPGEKTREEIIASVDHGFWIDELMGVHMADPISGEFSLGCTGWAIRSGRLAEPFTGMAVAGTLEQLWQRVEAVGNDLRFFGTEGSPTVLINRLNMSGK